MKKVLSVILAIMMIATFAPMVFAVSNVEAAENFVYEFSRALGYANSVYESDKLKDIIVSKYFIFEETEFYYSNFEESKEWIDKTGDKISVYAAEIKSLNDIVEKYIEENGVVIVANLTKYYYLAYRMIFFTDWNNVDKDNIENYYDKEAHISAIEAEEELFKFLETIENGTPIPENVQEMVEEILEPCYVFATNVYNCYNGCHIPCKYSDLGNGTHMITCSFCKSKDIVETHTWGSSDDDSTTEEDCTNTSKCIYCDAVDTVVDEGSKIDDKNSMLFSNIFELIKLFINLLMTLFK